MRKIFKYGLTVVLVALVIALAACSGTGGTPTPGATPGAATRLVFTTQPASAIAGSGFVTPPVVTVEDASGNTVTSPPALVVLAITPGTGSSGAVLFGGTRAVTTNGAAAFRDISIDAAGSGYTLTATAKGLTSATSSPFNIAAGAAAQLAFTTQPSGGAAGSAFTVPAVVTLEDTSGNRVTGSAAVTVTITPLKGAVGAVLSGKTTVNAVNGVATFTDLAINLTESSYTLTATSDGLNLAVSTPFTITPSAAAKLDFIIQPDGDTPGPALTAQPIVMVEDTYGNTVTGSTATVTVAITPRTGAAGAVLSGKTTVNATAGIVVFTDLAINRGGSGYTLTATGSGLAPATSEPFDVVTK